MGFDKRNKPRPAIVPSFGSSGAESGGVQRAIQELGQVVNNQGEGLTRMSSKLSEVLFRLSKAEEQIQLHRLAIRVQRDRLNVAIASLMDLGLVDREIFNMVYSMTEVRMLPITQDGRVSPQISLTRYSTPPGMPEPAHMRESA
jgi:hypothetical protein